MEIDAIKEAISQFMSAGRLMGSIILSYKNYLNLEKSSKIQQFWALD